MGENAPDIFIVGPARNGINNKLGGNDGARTKKGDNWEQTLGNLNLEFVIKENYWDSLPRASHPKTHWLHKNLSKYFSLIIN